MKKLLLLTLMIICAFTVVACFNTTPSESTTQSQPSVESPGSEESNLESEPEITSEPESEITSEPESEIASEPESEIESEIESEPVVFVYTITFEVEMAGLVAPEAIFVIEGEVVTLPTYVGEYQVKKWINKETGEEFVGGEFTLCQDVTLVAVIPDETQPY